MDLFETLGLGPRQPEENELYVAIYVDPVAIDDAAAAADAWEDPGEAGPTCAAAPAEADGAAASRSSRTAGCPSTVNDRLEALRARCTAWLLPYTTDYVWNKDPLVLRASSRQPPPWERRRGGVPGGRRRAPPASGGGGPHPESGLSSSNGAGGSGEGCVWAVMRFGDAVDDEWWAVWLLLRMTRELQDLSVQVWDNDGQFLLIEAAYALPRWLKPETADNRVWLRRGRLHIIPLPSAMAPDLPPSPGVAQALDVLREDRFSTASQRVQRPIDERLAGYPARARHEQQHTARCLLPAPLAAALRSEPQLVAELVEAFYHRDAEDMRAAARMRVLPPSLERVQVLIRMTRVHYAQLAQQRFSAPRGLSMPPPDSPLAKAADLGLKLTVAAEIICARVHLQQPQICGDGVSEQRQQPALLEGATAANEAVAGASSQRQAGAAAGAQQAAGAALSEARFSADPAWRRFKASLEANGYFQGNIPGSRRYKELMAAALEAFAAGLAVDGEGGGDAAGGSEADATAASSRDPRRRLAELVRGTAAAGLSAVDMADTSSPTTAEDDDSWLEQQPDRLQAELDRRQAELTKRASRHGVDAFAKDAEDSAKPRAQGPMKEVDAEDIASKLRSFMEQLSGLEGVETPGEAPGVASTDGGGGGIEFNPARFLRELEQVLGAAGPAGRDSKRQHPEQGRERLDGDDEEDEGETSTEEGSSFFSSDEDEDELSGEGDDDRVEQEEAGDAQPGQAAGSGLGFGFGDRHTGQDQPKTAASASAAVTGAAVLATTPAAAAGVVRSAQPGAHAPAGDEKPQAVASAAAQTGTAAAAAAVRRAATQPQAVLKRGFLSAAKPGGKDAYPAAMGAGTRGVAAAGGGTVATAAADRLGCPPAAPGFDASVPAAGPATAPAGGSSASRRQQLDWEIRTATDSDDNEDYDSERSGQEREEREYDDEEGDATARLLAALGVESSGRDGGGTSDSGDDDSGSGPGAAGSRGGPADQQRRQRRSVGQVHADKAMAVAAAAAAAKPLGSGDGGRSGRGDEVGDSFMPLYDSAMQDELAGTTLAQSFEYGLGTSGAGGRGVARVAGSSGAALGRGTGELGVFAGAGAGTQGQALQPVDLDMNLVRNLLRSYTAQQGTAGPAGNIAAMLGMSLPAGDVVED